MATSKTKAQIITVLARVYRNVYQRSPKAAKYIKESIGGPAIVSWKAIFDTNTSSQSKAQLISTYQSLWRDIYTRNGKAAKWIDIAIGHADLAEIEDIVSD